MALTRVVARSGRTLYVLASDERAIPKPPGAAPVPPLVTTQYHHWNARLEKPAGRYGTEKRTLWLAAVGPGGAVSAAPAR